MIERTSRIGFTLLEIVIVIVVIGILASMVIPRFANAQSDVRVASAGEDILGMVKALETYNANNGYWPAETAVGVVPPEITANFKGGNPFAKPCPIGSVYDYNNSVTSSGRTVSISLQPSSASPAPTITDALALDSFLDDGVLNSGRFQTSGNGYAYRISQ